MRIIGLCGSIGCGKSTRCKHAFKAINAASTTAAYNRAVLLDADKAAHALYEPGSSTYLKVVEAFGKGILADPSAVDAAPPPASSSSSSSAAAPQIDRRRLGGVVFADPSKLALLNSIVWPPLAESVWGQMQAAAAAEAAAAANGATAGSGGKTTGGDRTCYLLEAALLPEMKPLLALCDEVWLFYANDDVAVPRVVARGFSEEEARKRIAVQPGWEARAQALEAAGYVRVPATAAPQIPEAEGQDKQKVYRVFDTNNTTDAGLAESLTEIDRALGL